MIVGSGNDDEGTEKRKEKEKSWVGVDSVGCCGGLESGVETEILGVAVKVGW